jgi:threonyl-tRNA synthetase
MINSILTQTLKTSYLKYSFMVKITFPDGSIKEFKDGITGLEIAKSIAEGLARNALAIKVNSNLIDLSVPITDDCKIQIITFKDKEGIEVFRHSTAHLLAAAVVKLWPDALPTIGPSVDEGFYYDFDKKEPFRPEDLEKIEAEMKAMAKANLGFERIELTKAKAKQLFKDNPYKLELIDEYGKDLSAYKLGDFVDLCRGPHIPSSGKIEAVKLTKISGCYWHGDSAKQSLQRIYGISFPENKELKNYLVMIEEAEKRDHRKIGRDMGLFSFHDEAPGMPFFHDKGTFIWNKLVEYTTELMKKRDYQINKTPLILNKDLWIQSGHWDHYKNNMYFTKIDSNDFAVKPMNCPGNILIYKADVHSYRDMPIKAGEFGLVHRHELSGVLSGLFRVRCFTQDDAHVFCTPEQIEEQIKELLGFVDELYKTFGFEYYIELSTKPEKAMGDPKLWELADSTLKKVLDESGKKYKINPGDGAFYGPKIDFHLKDAIGRTWQCGTIQLDFQMPEKFDLNYEGADGKKHRPVMLHRAILGSVERFMGILVENYAGKFPLWISPVQIKILPIADRHIDYCNKVKDKLKDSGLRAVVNDRAETTNKKVRDAQLENFNYILVVGDKEIENNTVNVRTRENQVLGEKKADEFLAELLKEIKDKK